GPDADRAALDGRRTGDDAVGWEVAGDDVRVEPVLDERPVVGQQPDALTRVQLAFGRVCVVIFLRAAREHLVTQFGQVGMPWFVDRHPGEGIDPQFAGGVSTVVRSGGSEDSLAGPSRPRASATPIPTRPKTTTVIHPPAQSGWRAITKRIPAASPVD